MKQIVGLALVVVLAACGEDAPPPKPEAQTPPPQPQAAAPAAAAPAPQQAEAPKPDPNKELARKVKQALEGERKIQAAAIDVTAASGKVTLWGTAATAEERTLAGQVASKVEGVTAVDNQLKIVKGS